MFFFTSRICTSNIALQLVCRSVMLSIIFACGLSAIVRAQDGVVHINYGKIVDASQLTHSGQTVGEILNKLKRYAGSTNAPDGDVEAELEAYQKQGDALERRRKAYNRRVSALRARPRTGLTVQAAEALIRESNALEREYASLEQESAALKLIYKSLKSRVESYAIYEASRQLQAEVEPFLERYAFLLEDALETSDLNKAKQPLMDIGSLFPEGEAQPAWADLVRTRRYYVLSDGKGFVRLFVPGTNPEQALNAHYGVLRHVLNWVLRSSAQATSQLTVQLYAYENDFSTQTLKLYAKPQSFSVKSALPPRPRSVALDLAAIEQFLNKGRALEGAYLDDRGALVLYGSQPQQRPLVDGQPLSLADLAAAYRAVFYAGHGDAYISLDASPYPEQVNVNFGGRLADTRIGWVVLRADMRFKTLASGLDPLSGSDLTGKLRQAMPDFLTQVERRKSAPKEEVPEFEGTRFWFYPDSIDVKQSADGKFMKISSPRFTGDAERQEASSGDQQLSRKTPSWTANTMAHLNRNYSAYAKVFPELAELDHVGNLLALFSWLQQKQRAGELTLDLDALLDVELPKCGTPQRRPQMLIGYLNKGNRVEPQDFSYVTEEIAASRPRGRGLKTSLKGHNLPSTDMEILKGLTSRLAIAAMLGGDADSTAAAIGGGIDLGMKKVVKNAKPASPPEHLLYQRLKKSAPETDVPTPSKSYARSNARPSVEPYRASTPKPHRILSPEPQPAERDALSWSRIEGVDKEVLTFGPAEKPKWVRVGDSNPLSLAPAKTARLGEDGSVVAFTRFDRGEQLSYRLTKAADGMVVETTPRVATTAEDSAVIETALQRGETPTQAWRYLPEDTRIAAIEKAPGNRTAILEEYSNNDFRLTYYKDGKPGESFTGKRAFTELEDIARSNVGGGGKGASPGDGTAAGSGGGGDRGGSNKLSFIHASDDGDNVRLMIGEKRKDVPVAEMENLLNNPTGRSSTVLDDIFRPKGDAPGEFVIYRDALTRRPERLGGSLKAGRTDDPTRLAIALRQRYKEARIYLDDEVESAAKNQKALSPLRGPADLGVLAPEESFDVTDHGHLRKIKDALNTAGIRVFSTAEGTRGLPNILLISGHNDANLVTYLTSLGEQGLLKDKVLILNTCYAVDNPNLAHQLIQKYGARGIYLHTETIRPIALQPVMDQLGVVLKEAERSGAAVHPSELLDRAIDRVLLDESLSPRLKSEVIKLKRGVLQISSADSLRGDRQPRSED